MHYVSTRDPQARVCAQQAVVMGLSREGGLFAPETLPHFSLADIEQMQGVPYALRSQRILAPFFDALPDGAIAEMTAQAYAQPAYDAPEIAKLVTLPDVSVLELWHGPTQAFKDIALTLLPRLLVRCARLMGETRQIAVVVATSGDTGKAALEGFSDVGGTHCIAYYPEGGVSPIQRLQMVTQRGDNVSAIAVHGNFDDAQTGVKRIFSDEALGGTLSARGITLSSANSINWGRLAPQIAYYFSAYADLCAAGRIRMGDPVNFAVPTGNFGNILAGEYAARMGLPIGRLLCASNQNNVLADFLRTGTYDARRAFYRTSSPSMDILISSNLERMLYLISGDQRYVCSLMNDLRESGRYALDGALLSLVHERMWGGWAGDAQVREEIARTCREYGYVLDPHTAVARRVHRDYVAQTGDDRPCVLIATASPHKFPCEVLAAIDPDGNHPADEFACCREIERVARLPIPSPIAALARLPERHLDACAPGGMARALQTYFDRKTRFA